MNTINRFYGLVTAVSAILAATSFMSRANAQPINPPQSALHTNNYVTTAAGKGELVYAAADGFTLRDERGYQVHCIKWEQVSDADLMELLKTPELYQSLTTFINKTPQEAWYECQPFNLKMRAIWLEPTNLSQRIISRLRILETMKNYNNLLLYNKQPRTVSVFYSAADPVALHQAQLREDELKTSAGMSRQDALNTSKMLIGALGGDRRDTVAAYRDMLEDTKEAQQALPDAIRQRVAEQNKFVEQRLYVTPSSDEGFSSKSLALKSLGFPVNADNPAMIPTLTISDEVDQTLGLNPYANNGSPNKGAAPTDSIVEFLQTRAGEGSAEAQYGLALSYLNGSHGLEKDVLKAKRLLESAAAQGHALAKNRLAELNGQ
jgi:hypothetical protein